jgi:5-formyltetrahydrofolate cyclo-ligase
MNLKAALRQGFRTRLEQVEKSEADATAPSDRQKQLNLHLKDLLLPYLNGSTSPLYWAAYQPLPGEADPRTALQELKQAQPSLVWVFPRMVEETLRFFAPPSDLHFTTSQVGTLQTLREPDPLTCNEIGADQIAGYLIPGLAFDQDCRRLGRGKGFYDRYFAESAPAACLKPLKIGIAFDFQIASDQLPSEPHDIQMDIVLTEARFFRTATFQTEQKIGPRAERIAP